MWLNITEESSGELIYGNKVGFAMDQTEKLRALQRDSDPTGEPGDLAPQRPSVSLYIVTVS